MKQIINALAFLCVFLLFSCGKPQATDRVVERGKEITFTSGYDMPEVEITEPATQTKTTAVTSLSSFWVGASTLSGTTESSVWNNVVFSGSNSSSFAASGNNKKYWPANTVNPNYIFYATNAPSSGSGPLVADGAGTYINVADCSTDIVVARRSDSVPNTTNQLNFKHILARIGSISVEASDAAFTITSCTIRVVSPKLSGRYNIKTEEWTNVSASGTPAVIYNGAGGQAQDAGLWLLPGTYELSASWTEQKGTHVKNREASGIYITVTAGNVRTLSAQIVVDKGTIVFTYATQAWDNTYSVTEIS